MSEPIRTSDGLYGVISRVKLEPVETPADHATAEFLREVFKALPAGRLIRMERDDKPNHAWMRSSLSYTTHGVRRKHGLAGLFRQRQQRRIRNGRSGRFDREIERLRAEYDRG